VDAFTHSFCADGHVGTKGVRVSTMWREGRKGPEGSPFEAKGDLAGSSSRPFPFGDNEGAILWTPLLTPFVQTDTLAPKGPGFLPCGGRVEKDLKGRHSNQRVT
jgi:hypothetical protein